jgi:hypothetical protein
MEQFFYEDVFCNDLEDLANILEIHGDNVNDLPLDWQVRIELSNYESIFNIDADILCELLVDKYEDRLLPDFEEIEGKQLLKALKESIDFDKLIEKSPKLCYANGQFATITKEQLVDYLV